MGKVSNQYVPSVAQTIQETVPATEKAVTRAQFLQGMQRILQEKAREDNSLQPIARKVPALSTDGMDYPDSPTFIIRDKFPLSLETYGKIHDDMLGVKKGTKEEKESIATTASSKTEIERKRFLKPPVSDDYEDDE